MNERVHEAKPSAVTTAGQKHDKKDTHTHNFDTIYLTSAHNLVCAAASCPLVPCANSEARPRATPCDRSGCGGGGGGGRHKQIGGEGEGP